MAYQERDLEVIHLRIDIDETLCGTQEVSEEPSEL